MTAVARFVARMGTPEYRREVQERTGQKIDATNGYSVQTIKSTLIPLSRTFASAKRHLGHAGENPVAALDLDERPGYKAHKMKKRKLGRDELDLLIEHAESPWREIIATAAALGTRLGETLGIAWRCIDFENGTVSIEQQANAKRQLARVKTQTGVRRIEAPDWLISMFRELKIRSPYCNVTMTTYADEIEEANDNAIRKARVNALFGSTKMAARMAATDGETMRQTASDDEAEVIALRRLGDSSQQAASA